MTMDDAIGATLIMLLRGHRVDGAFEAQ